MVMVFGVGRHLLAFQAQFGQQLDVGLHIGVAGDQELVSVENRIRPRHEAQGLHGIAQLLATSRQPHAGLGHQDAGHCNHAHKIQRVNWLRVGQRRARHAHQAVDGHRFWVGVQVGQLGQQTSPVHRRFAHAHNAAAAHADARSPHIFQGVQTVLVAPGVHHLGVVLGRRVQVVVVIIQARVAQGGGLVWRQHAQGGAGLQAQAFDGADQLGHFFDVAVFRGAPRRAHAKAGGPSVFGGLSGLHHGVHRHQFLSLDAGVELGRLRAISAVFRTAPGFHRQQRRQLNVPCGPMLAVYLLGLQQQIQKWFVQQGLHLAHGPAILACGRGRRRRGRGWRATLDELNRLFRHPVGGCA